MTDAAPEPAAAVVPAAAVGVVLAAVPVVTRIEAVELAVAVPLVPVEVPELPAELDTATGVSKVVGQVRSNLGLVERLLVMANFILLSGLESRRVYQKAVVFPKSLRHPTSCQ